MDIADFFEYELPIITIDTNNADFVDNEATINIKASVSENYHGIINISNIGGGKLEGNIYGEKSISFDKTEFSENQVSIKYTINLTKDIETVEVIITSNGGEYFLKFQIETSSTILYIDGYSIHNLIDFYKYFEKDSIVAKKIFVNHDFLLWLHAINYPHIEVYEHIRSDSNKDRAINNFFVFNKLKEHSKVVLNPDEIFIKINPFIQEEYSGSFKINLIGTGYVCETLNTNSKYIKLEKEHITTSDFKNNSTIEIGFTIDKINIEKTLSLAKINLTGCKNTFNIRTKILDPLEINLINNYSHINKDLELHVSNNTSKPIKIDIEPEDSFIKLDSSTYIIEKTMNIPIYIRLSKLMQAQKTMKKRDIFTSYLRITSNFQNKNIYKNIQIIVGDFK